MSRFVPGGLVLFWNMETLTPGGTRMKDLSYSGNDGDNPNSSVDYPGVYGGRARRFQNFGDQITARPNDEAGVMHFGLNVTRCGWFLFEGFGVGAGGSPKPMILGNFDDDREELCLFKAPYPANLISNEPNFPFTLGAEFGAQQDTGVRIAHDDLVDAPWVLNAWHWAAVVAKDDGTLTIYLDGVVVGDFTWTPFLQDAGPAAGGNDSGAVENGGVWRGSLDELRVYNRALTREEILAVYRDGTHYDDIVNPYVRAPVKNRTRLLAPVR